MSWLSPRLWGLHLLLVVALAFTISLGLWQLRTYDQQREEASRNHTSDEVAALQDLLGPDDPYTSYVDYRPVTITGSFGPTESQVWVSGREHDGADGYWLVAPVLLDEVEPTSAGRPAAIAVVRGWSAEAGAFPEASNGPVTVTGVLQAGDARGSGFDAETRTLDAVRIPALVNVMPYDLYGGYAIATGQQPADPAVRGGEETDGTEQVSLEPATVPAPVVDTSAGLRNLFYAFEWWIFGAFALFMWWRMCQDLRREAIVTGTRVPAAKRAAQEAALRRRANDTATGDAATGEAAAGEQPAVDGRR